MPPEERAVLRPLGAMEYVYWLMDMAARANFVFIAKLGGEIPFQVLKAASERVRKASPLLDAAILPDDAHGAVFVKATGHVTVTEAIITSEGFTSCVEDEQHERFDTEKGPLFRIKSVKYEKSQSLVFCFHHSIADGISGSRMVLRFLEAADSIMQHKRPEISCVADFGPAEKLFPEEHTGGGALFRAMRWMSGMNLDKNILRKYPALPVDVSAPPQERRERFVFKVMEKDAALRLSQRAKSENTSLNAAICAAQLIALSGEYPSDKDRGIGHLSLVDLRKRLVPTVPGEAMNVFISTVESYHKVSPETDFWGLARNVQAGLEKELEQGSQFERFPWLARVIKATRRITPNTYEGSVSLLKQGQMTRPHVSVVSNIGKIQAARGFSSFTLLDLFFSMAFSGTALFGSAINSWNGRLSLSFSHADPCISSARAGKIAQRVMDILRER